MKERGQKGEQDKEASTQKNEFEMQNTITKEAFNNASRLKKGTNK